MANSRNSNVPTAEEVIANGEIIFEGSMSKYQEMYLLEVDTFGEDGEFDCWLTDEEQTVMPSHIETLMESSWWWKKEFSSDDLKLIKYGGLSALHVREKRQQEKADDEFWKSRPRNYFQIASGYIVANTFYISDCLISGKETKRWVRQSISCKLTKKNTPSKVNSQFPKKVNKYELELATSAWKITGYVQPFIYIVVGSGYVDTNIEFSQHQITTLQPQVAALTEGANNG